MSVWYTLCRLWGVRGQFFRSIDLECVIKTFVTLAALGQDGHSDSFHRRGTRPVSFLRHLTTPAAVAS